MELEYIIIGFFMRLVTGLDDMLVQIPLIANIAKTVKGKIGFVIGIIIAVLLAMTIALFAATALHNIPHFNVYSAIAIFILAGLVWSEKLHPKNKIVKGKISNKRFGKILMTGFLVTGAAILDDIVVYIPLFADGIIRAASAVSGILIAVALEIVAVLYFSDKIKHLKHTKGMAVVGLLVFGMLTLFKWV